jgi:hypothetical protein
MSTNQSTEQRLSKLRRWNIVVGLILAVQAIMIALLTNDFALPVTDNRISTCLPMVQAQPVKEPQLRALDRVLLQLFNYDCVNFADNRYQRHRCPIGYLRHKRLYDTFWCFAGEV